MESGSPLQPDFISPLLLDKDYHSATCFCFVYHTSKTKPNESLPLHEAKIYVHYLRLTGVSKVRAFWCVLKSHMMSTKL